MKLKFWEKSDKEKEIASLKAEVEKLKVASLLKDELYTNEYIKFENFKRSVYTTFSAIALANNGEYVVDNNFVTVVLQEELSNKLSISEKDNGILISIKDNGEQSL
jgi:hypothetical protein